MPIEEKLRMYREKKHFIAELANVFVRCPSGHSIGDIYYEVFHKEFNGNHFFNEWIVVCYFGGAKAYCRVNGNSNTANFRAISDLLDGGYYKEEVDYHHQTEAGFKRVNLAKMLLTVED